MSAIAIIHPVLVNEQLKTRVRRFTAWAITWSGPEGKQRADVHYSSARRAEEMARACGASEIIVRTDAEAAA